MNLEREFLKIERGKTKASVRQLHLTERVKKILESRLNTFEGQYLFPFKDVDRNQPVKSLDKEHREVLNRTGLKFRVYDLRHSFATRAVEAGIDLLILSQLLAGLYPIVE